MRPKNRTGFVVALAVAGLIAPGAGATLKKYAMQFTHFSTSNNNSPNPSMTPSVGAPGSLAVIDDSGPSPILKRLYQFSDSSITTIVPGLGGFIYTATVEGRSPTGEFTGTGSTDTTIAWGLVTGWTTTGTWWCNAAPAFICNLADRLYQESVEPPVKSEFYDMGTWTFHGTGWTGTPWVQRTHDDPGNDQYFFRGALLHDGTIPALPVAGFAVLGGSLVAVGLAALRRRKG